MGETARAAAAFEDYWLMGPKRSLAKLAEHYRRSPARERPTGQVATLERWSARYGWQRRVLERQAGQARALREAALRQQEAAIEQHLEVVREQLEIAERYLRPPAGTEDAEGWKPAPRELEAAALAIDKAIMHERLALGLPTTVTRQDVLLRQTLRAALEVQQQLRLLIEEEVCDDCRARVADQLRGLAERQQALAAELG